MNIHRIVCVVSDRCVRAPAHDDQIATVSATFPCSHLRIPPDHVTTVSGSGR